MGGRFFFSVSEEVVYSLDLLFDIFRKSIHLTHVLRFGKEELVYDYLFTSQSEFHTVRGAVFFLLYLHLFCPNLRY